VTFVVQSREDDAEKLPPAFYDSVTTGFFSAVRIPLVAGRTFTDADNAQSPRVTIISRSTAKKFFPDEDPLGRRLIPPRSGPQAPVPLEIVGVVGDVPRNGLNATTPFQSTFRSSARPDVWHAPHSLIPPVGTLTNTIQRQIWLLDPDQPISNIALVRTLRASQRHAAAALPHALQPVCRARVDSSLRSALRPHRLQRHAAPARIRIRIALGAQATDVTRLVLGQGAKLTAIGLGLGLLAARPRRG